MGETCNSHEGQKNIQFWRFTMKGYLAAVYISEINGDNWSVSRSSRFISKETVHCTHLIEPSSGINLFSGDNTCNFPYWKWNMFCVCRRTDELATIRNLFFFNYSCILFLSISLLQFPSVHLPCFLLSPFVRSFTTQCLITPFFSLYYDKHLCGEAACLCGDVPICPVYFQVKTITSLPS
jgi:hypothetical protein